MNSEATPSHNFKSIKEIEAGAKTRMEKAILDLQHNMSQVRTGRAWKIDGASSNWRVTHAFALMGGGFMNDNPELGNAVSAAVANFFKEVMPVTQVASSVPRASQVPQVQRTKTVVTAASSRN